MREILFRGKRINNGEWVYGDLRHRGSMTAIDGDMKISKSLAREMRPLHSTNSTQKIMREIFPVDPATVGQYTGLTDKNGKKIFEGDVIKTFTEYYGNRIEHKVVVQWCDDIENDSFGEPFTSGYVIHGGDWEIIGNIHDNLEIMEG